MPSLGVKFPGSVNLEGLLEVPEINPEIGAGLPMITILGIYEVEAAWLMTIVELAEKPATGSPFGKMGLLIRLVSKR